MIVTKEETLSIRAYLRVKRADIVNGIGIETGYHWKK